MNHGRPVVEKYTRGSNLLNYVVYGSTSVAGNDEVLQHKLHDTEMAHITLHPNGTVNFHETRLGIGRYLRDFVMSNLVGFSPQPSSRLKQFLSKVRNRI